MGVSSVSCGGLGLRGIVGKRGLNWGYFGGGSERVTFIDIYKLIIMIRCLSFRGAVIYNVKVFDRKTTL